MVDFAGTYRASARETRVQVSTWGPDCGPRPQNSTEPGGESAEVKKQGARLALALPDRTLRTDSCWTPNPTVRVTNAVATAARWRTECATPEGEAKRERGVYTVTATTRNTLELLEESEYDWQLNDSHCIAKVRSTQKLERGATPPTSAEPEPEPEAAPPGCKPGPAARIRLRPREATISPGERVCFTVKLTDAAGCAVPLDPGTLKWNLSKPEAALASLSGACFKAAPSAADAEGRFEVAVTSGSLRGESLVLVVPTDLSDITARRGAGAAAGDDTEEGVGGIVSGLGIVAVVKRSSAGALIAAAASVLLALGGFSWFLHTRSREKAAAAAAALRSQKRNSQRSQPVSAPPSTPSGSSEQLICPLCRRGYPAGTERCTKDAGRPIPYAEFLRQAQAAERAASTCPACAVQLAPGALFCGACGAKVTS
jgi:hypothetical protein